jgi:glycopeptide antibiotics resistance protein
MLTERERQFIEYWEAVRERQSRWQQQLMAGIPMGLLFALPVLAIVFTGKLWYKRADMAMNAMMNPYVLIVAVFVITVFVAIFYKRHQWDQKDQYYRQLKRERPDAAIVLNLLSFNQTISLQITHSPCGK